ncbi:MAG TPA: ARMT1-like domain-containing protein [Methanospirillum sp.]|uniref:damage-control phosphatase ARMT1 family protein n=1 Tax=Methanospirillum sp. TaxID=45200 RepID=UPI002CCBC95C|nr:ARMT1-like domain-containing protein [Methanospirillum sp.]HWQ65129.1 ARMT1-like domain-containing protein [Methanospirillum sp.]
MHHDDRCFDCLLSRVRLEAELVEVQSEKFQPLMEHATKLLTFLQDTPYTHPVVASLLHRSVYFQLGTTDPFLKLKKQSNREAAKALDLVREHLTDFRSLVTAAVIGNIFDYGVKGHTISDDFTTFFNKEFASGLYIDDTDKILPMIRRVVYLTDNCGELVFDRLLIEFLKNQGSYVTVVVRDAPILNDATMADAMEMGLDTIADHIYTNGAGAEIGIRFDLLPSHVQNELDSCTLVISKGMANYESLREETGLPPIAYLLAAKCEPIAEELGVPRGAKLAALRISQSSSF